MLRWLAALVSCALILGCNTIPSRPHIQHDRMSVILNDAPFYIRTRIVVEQYEGKAVRDLVEITKDIAYCENLFKDLNIHFVIVSVGIARCDQSWIDYLNSDADLYPMCLNVYYCHQPYNFSKVGLSRFPWDAAHRNGLALYALERDNSVFAHELGHYFGLLHTFQRFEVDGLVVYDDYVDDTPSPIDYGFQDPVKNSYYKYNNIMNYHTCSTDSVTPGQIERMRWFLLNYRTEVLMRNIFEGEFPDKEPRPTPVTPQQEECGPV